MFYNFIYQNFAENAAGFLNLLKYITFRSGAALTTSFLLVLIFAPIIIRKFAVWQAELKTVRDHLPHHAKIGTPSMGGVLIIGSMLVSTLLWANLSNPYILICIAVVFAFATIGFVDDYLSMTGRRNGGIPGKIRLILQFGITTVALIVAQYFHTGEHFSDITFVPLLKDLVINLNIVLFCIFASFVCVGTANGVNLTDGLDGLAIFPSVVVAGGFAGLAYIIGRSDFTSYLNLYYIPQASELAIFASSLVGAGLGFLWFNAHPAKIFMGDVGSLGIGAALGMLAVLTKLEFLLLIMGGLFVVESLSVIIQVYYFKATKKRFFKMAPIHHHFEKGGVPETTIVTRFWIISILLVIIAFAVLKIR
ncbi:MAG TPA: phospho-N-acetylmuramoyl-pentapeptide-transferase [Alphaproteobacteria bacterium]|nr:phospho-N-acetylmuramoyl-pentapeptide-transferase [Alphaproteobacteria bacterium]